MKKYKNVLIVGRFQPFHLEHLRLAAAAAEQAEHLWVGITRPFGKHIPEAGGVRDTDGANPLPYWLRRRSIETALINDAGLPGSGFSIVAVPLVREMIGQIVPPDTIFLTTIVEEWGVQKEDLFRKAGFGTSRIDLGGRTISGTMIREKIMNKDPGWKDLVPECMGEQYAALIEKFVRQE